jgi:hypothetical protein
MKNLKTLALSFALAFTALVVSAQTNTFTQTSTTAAMTATQNFVTLTAATNVAANRGIMIDAELMVVGKYYVSGLIVPVVRNTEKKSVHATSTMALIGKMSWFSTYDPFGGCTAASTNVTPWVTVPSQFLGGDARQWLCSTILNRWVAGWNNDVAVPQVTAAVASAAGLVTPSGPLFHITGALAITGFNIPLGFAYGSFTVIPDGAFTTTTANNIANASTGVVGKPLTFTYDANTAKFYPSY